MSQTKSVIAHDNFVAARKELVDVVKEASPGSLIWLIGPSGAGKSELRRAVMRELTGDPALWGRGMLPAICTRACLTDRDKFNTKDLYSRLAKSVRQPNIEWMVPNDSLSSESFLQLKTEVNEASKFWQAFRLPGTEHALREEFESTARARGVKFVYLEEVHSIRLVHKGQSFANHMTSLMQLAEETQFVLILIGSHLAESLWTANQEVLNRSLFVYLSRYGDEDEKDMRAFAEVVKSLGMRFPLEVEDLLIKEIALMYSHSAGLIGRLLIHLKKAEVLRRKLELPAITSSHLHSCASEQSDLVDLWNYARAFDAFMVRKPSSDSSSVLRTLWGISLQGGQQ